MRDAIGWVLLAGALSAPAFAAPLTLEEALASVSAPHPDRRVAESELALARADRERVESQQDFYLYLDGSLRTGWRPDGDWKPDNVARIVGRKPLYDFGRTRQEIGAAEQEFSARQVALLDVENTRRLDITARFFEVLLADMQYAADNERMAVTYMAWHDALERFEVGQISHPELLRLEATYQDAREQRYTVQNRMSSARQKLSHALNRPGQLHAELAEPALKGNLREVPDYEVLLAWVMRNNPRILIMQTQLVAVDARVGAIRAENGPTLDMEVMGGGFSRTSSTRDDLSVGLVFNIPLYQGGRMDARVARELAHKARLSAELEQLKRDLAETLYTNLQEVDWLRNAGRVAANKQVEFRDAELERARAEYELELKTNLGVSLVNTQLALLRRKQVEYQLALALARLDALSGGSLPPSAGDKK